MMSAVQTFRGMAEIGVACVVTLLVVACDDHVVGMDRDSGLRDVPDASVTGAARWAMTGANASRNGRGLFVGPGAGALEPEHAVVFLASADGFDTTTAVNAVGPDGAVYVHVRDSDEHGQVMSLRPDGGVRWVYPEEPVAMLGGLALSAAGQLTFEGRVVVEGTDPGWPDLFAFVSLTVDADLRWAWLPPEQLTRYGSLRQFSSPVFDAEGNIYIVLTYEQQADYVFTSYLHSFSADGQPRWSWSRMVGTFTAIPAISSDGTLYVNVDRDSVGADNDPENGLYALDLDGNEKWFVPRSSYEVGHLAISDDGTLYTNARVEGDGAAMLTIAPSGELLQQFWPPEVLTSWGTNVAIATDGTVYAAARVRDDAYGSPYRGKLFAFHPDGTLKWSAEFEQCPTGGLAIDATGAVYLSTFDRGGMDPSGILGFELDGTVRMSLSLGERLTDGGGVSGPRFFATSVVLADDGLLYIGSHNGRLHIIRDSSSPN